MEMENVVVVEVKEEEEEESPTTMPRPMAGLHDATPPPFLMKTYEMVEDRDTDSVVSWSAARNSFVVWDSHKLATTLLPKYFKHGNFSSFIRQLNTYGFKKVDSDRWEFANECFLAGQKHLLRNIKRRRNVCQNTPQQQGGAACVEVGLGQLGSVTEMEMLRRDRSVLMVEILKLRQQQQSSRAQLAEMGERLETTERKQQQTMSFLARALSNPAFVQQLISGRDQGKQQQQQHLAGRGRKRPLPATPSAENLLAVAQEAAIESEMEKLFTAAAGDSEASGLGVARDDDPIDLGAEVAAVSDAVWEELMGGDMVAVDDGLREEEQLEIIDDMEVGEALAGNESGEWGDDDMTDLVEQMGCLGSNTRMI